jgi:hypothetical protein
MLSLKNLVLFPAHHELADLEKTILPELKPFEHGWRLQLQEALATTIQRIFLQHKNFEDNSEVKEKGISCTFVGGCDGSGSHAVYNSATSLAEGIDTSHMIVCGFALTEI